MGGTAKFGSGNKNNGLIYAIGFSLLGHGLDDSIVLNIRESINNQHIGAEKGHQLASNERIVQHILQSYIRVRFEKGKNIRQAQVIIDSGIANVQPVHIGTSGDIIRIFYYIENLVKVLLI